MSESSSSGELSSSDDSSTNDDSDDSDDSSINDVSPTTDHSGSSCEFIVDSDPESDYIPWSENDDMLAEEKMIEKMIEFKGEFKLNDTMDIDCYNYPIISTNGKFDAYCSDDNDEKTDNEILYLNTDNFLSIPYINIFDNDYTIFFVPNWYKTIYYTTNGRQYILCCTDHPSIHRYDIQHKKWEKYTEYPYCSILSHFETQKLRIHPYCDKHICFNQEMKELYILYDDILAIFNVNNKTWIFKTIIQANEIFYIPFSQTYIYYIPSPINEVHLFCGNIDYKINAYDQLLKSGDTGKYDGVWWKTKQQFISCVELGFNLNSKENMILVLENVLFIFNNDLTNIWCMDLRKEVRYQIYLKPLISNFKSIESFVLVNSRYLYLNTAIKNQHIILTVLEIVPMEIIFNDAKFSNLFLTRFIAVEFLPNDIMNLICKFVVEFN